MKKANVLRMTVVLFAINSLTTAIVVNADDGASLVKPTLVLNLEYAKGKSGPGIVFSGNSRLQFPIKYLKANAGTIEVWIKPESQKSFQYIISAGSFASQLFLTGVDTKGVNMLQRMKEEDGKYAYYLSLKHPCELLKNKRWIALAFVWAYTEKNKCAVQIYLDGKLVEERYNATIAKAWAPFIKQFAIGFNSSSFKAKGFTGMIDELRISNYPKTPKDIKKAFDLVSKGKSLRTEPGTTLLLNFKNSAEAKSSTTNSLSPKEVKAKYEKVLSEIE